MDQDIPSELQGFRDEIDVLDAQLIDVLARRFAVVRNVGHLKAQKDMEAVQPKRAQHVIDRAVESAQPKGVPEEFARRLYEMLIDEAHRIEHEILDEAQS